MSYSEARALRAITMCILSYMSLSSCIADLSLLIRLLTSLNIVLTDLV